ncbi:hypothetical protein [Thalassotalea sediminis]|uniref:hypothetical protein n=1 Tax=Thalassotalea sediminis TaxID=1759089 RepID=UPI0025728A94|nr:hypothetical protein [Thalassotalea sediminis]
MKLLKSTLLSSLLLLLTACGGHGFEGTYTSKVDSTLMQGMVNGLPKTTLVIGDNFIENNGNRVIVDEIFIRESAGKEYLVFKYGQQEQVLNIIDSDTLQQDMGMVKVTFKRK